MESIGGGGVGRGWKGKAGEEKKRAGEESAEGSEKQRSGYKKDALRGAHCSDAVPKVKISPVLE